MTIILQSKIEESQLQVISDVDILTKKLYISYLMVGAVARDLIDRIFGISSARLTEDIDLAMRMVG